MSSSKQWAQRTRYRHIFCQQLTPSMRSPASRRHCDCSEFIAVRAKNALNALRNGLVFLFIVSSLFRSVKNKQRKNTGQQHSGETHRSPREPMSNGEDWRRLFITKNAEEKKKLQKNERNLESVEQCQTTHHSATAAADVVVVANVRPAAFESTIRNIKLL